MRLVRKSFTLLLIWCLAILPISRAIPQEQLSQELESGKIIILSDKVGEIIDIEERNYYKLSLGSTNFRSAVVIQLPDSSLVIQLTEMKEGLLQQSIMQIDQEILEEFRKNIEKKPKITGVKNQAQIYEAIEQAQIKRIKYQIKIFEAIEQANILAKEKWTKEKWQEEIQYDRGGTYRGTSGLLGFTLGAAAGMLIGKGIQEKKVERTEYHPGSDWGNSSWTENFYSYKYKKAPYWGAVIGGISGAVYGHFLGKKADKKYYILVPKNIRMQETKSSWFGNFLFGFGIVGPVMGGLAGGTLYAPMTGKSGTTDFGSDEFLVGYLVGAIVGTNMMAALKGRAKHKKLWEESYLEGKLESSLDIEFILLDPTAFSIYPRMSPSGEIFYEYRMDILRIRF